MIVEISIVMLIMIPIASVGFGYLLGLLYVAKMLNKDNKGNREKW